MDEGLIDLMAARAREAGEAPAIVSPDGTAIGYGALAGRVREIGDAVAAAGIGPRDRIGIVVPDTRAFALAFLGAVRTATAAPIDARLPPAQLAGQFDRLRLTAVLTSPGLRERIAPLLAGRRLLVLSAEGGFAAGIEAAGAAAPAPPPRRPGGDDVAVLLSTSGSEGTPKTVPITHRNFAVRVARVAQWFDLTPADRSLCIMPLVHHSGLSNHLIVPLLTGGSTVLADGPEPGHVLDMIVRHRPTWFSASPTIVAALVDRAKAEPARIAGHALRFIRVATAAAPAALLADVERLFGIPAVQNYGLTETGTIVSNPLPPRARRRDTVGLAVGDAVVAVVDDDGRPLPPGGVGEIVVGDDGVMGGYDGEPPRSPPTFLDGRFRTGDLGTFDPDGHLRLVGRRKEAIKRGGATIAPAEVDAVLAAHPDVAAAAAFALPHPTLGEEVYAAIVLRPGATTAPDTILRDAGGRLSPAHRPKQVFVVDALPQTAIGKPLRHALAQRFAGAAVRSGAAARAPLDPMESMVAGLWAHALGQDQVDPDRGFAAQGGDAQRAAALAAALYAALDMDVPAAALMHPGTTVRTIAASARPRPARPL